MERSVCTNLEFRIQTNALIERALLALSYMGPDKRPRVHGFPVGNYPLGRLIGFSDK